MVRASVIVPARNAQATLGRTLERLQAQLTSVDYEVVVVDDGSTDRTREIAAAAGGRVQLHAQEAAGPAAARNRGVAESSGAVLAFCDADCFPVTHWLQAGVRALEEADLIQGKVLPDPAADFGPFHRSLWITHEVGLWETANLFVTRDLFVRVGGFDDWLLPVAGKAMAEDVWFGWRAKRIGARSAFCDTALAYHAVFPQTRWDYMKERKRCRHFPEMVAKMPELREAFLYRRCFLNSRTAAFDVGLVASAAAILSRRPWPLVGWLAFAEHVVNRAQANPSRRAEVTAVDLAADVITAWSLLVGTLRARSIVL